MSINMNWSYVCNHICSQLQSNELFINHFKTLSTNAQKVKHCLSEPFVCQLLDQFLTITGSAKHKKFWEKAKEFRIEGNDCFKGKRFQEAIEAYNQAITFAPIPDLSQSDEANSELSLSFANRSAVFYHLRQYDNCLADISNAFKYDYQLNPTKLLLRKANCFAQKRCFADVKSVLESDQLKVEDNDHRSDKQLKDLLKLIDEKGDKNAINCLNKTKPKIDLKFISNDLMPNASKSLELCSSESKGRYIIASADIKVSDVLFVELPFASVPLSPFYKTHCHHCYRRLLDRPVMPCLKCSQVRYCSDECANKSYEEYHNYECGLLNVMQDIGIAHLAFRTLLVCGIDSAIRVATNTSDSTLTPYLNNYESVYALVDHSNDFTLEDSLSYSMVSSLLLVLTQKSGLIEKESKEYDILGGIVMKHILQLITNGHAISSMESIAQSSDLAFEDKRIATALYPTISLMNHSCDPNVIAIYDKNMLIVRATKPIAKGQEVFNCYGPNFKRMATEKRLRILSEQYFFKCDCNWCSNGTQDLSCALVCSQCKDAIVFNDQKTQNSIFCQNCKKNDFDFKSILKDVEKGLNLSNEGSKLCDENKLIESEAKLLESIGILEKVLYSKNRSLGKVMDQLCRCYCRMNNWSKAVEFGRKSIEICGQVFGESSIEMTNELIKLSQIEFQLLNDSKKAIEESISDAKQCLITTSKAIRLLTNYSISDDDYSPQKEEMSKLEERLVFCDLFIKQFVKQKQN